MEESKSMQSSVIKYSLIIALISIILSVLVYVVDESILTKWWYGLLSLLIAFGLYLYAGFGYRKEVGGFLEFKKAFLFIFLVAIVAGLVNLGWSLVQFNVIDTELGSRLQRQVIENTENMMESFGAPEEQIEEQIEKLEAEDMFATGKLLQQGLIFTVVGGAIFGLIIGAIIKKKKEAEPV